MIFGRKLKMATKNFHSVFSTKRAPRNVIGLSVAFKFSYCNHNATFINKKVKFRLSIQNKEKLQDIRKKIKIVQLIEKKYFAKKMFDFNNLEEIISLKLF